MAKEYSTVVRVGINGKESLEYLNTLKSKVEELKAVKLQLAKDGKLGTKEYKDVEKAIVKLKGQVSDWEGKARAVENALKDINRVPMAQLIAAKKRVNGELNSMNRGTKDYIAKLKQLEAINKQIERQHKESSLPKWANWAVVGTAIGAMLTRLKRFAAESVQAFAELDDKFADVMKTTGMTKDEVRELDEELKKIDTRTSRIELLNLAQTAGKLGITGTEDVAAFVRAADQLNVALGEDLGGEEAIRNVGKLVDIFKLKEDLGLEKAMLSVGSAINTLGASSTANEGYIVDFTTKLAGTAPAANISIQSAMGYASTLDSLGQEAQVSGTAVSQAIRGMFTRTAEYARVAGMQVNEFKELLARDANEAFIKFLEGAGNTESLEGMSNAFASLHLRGTQAQQVLGALAQNVETLRAQQDIANTSFANADSVTQEYNTKNESAQAILEKRSCL